MELDGLRGFFYQHPLSVINEMSVHASIPFLIHCRPYQWEGHWCTDPRRYPVGLAIKPDGWLRPISFLVVPVHTDAREIDNVDSESRFFGRFKRGLNRLHCVGVAADTSWMKRNETISYRQYRFGYHYTRIDSYTTYNNIHFICVTYTWVVVEWRESVVVVG